MSVGFPFRHYFQRRYFTSDDDFTVDVSVILKL